MHVHARLALLLHLRHSPALVLHSLRCRLLWHTHARCTEFRCFWWLVARAQVHQSQSETLWGGSHGHKEGQRWGFRSGRRFASCLRGGGRGKISAGRPVAGQVVVQSPEQRPGPGSKVQPEVSDTQFVSPGRGLGIRQSMGWEKVSHTAQSGIWVLVCYLPILDTFGCNGGSRGHTRPPGSRHGTTVCVHTLMVMEQRSDHKLMTPSGMGLLVCGAEWHPSCRLGVVQEGMCQRD